MQAVHTFCRNDGETLEQLLQVCGSGRGTAREQWSLQAEMLVEPLAWDALWKLSKQFCKKFDVRFPCIAYVTVTSVNFENLSASVDVFSVQHVSVSLPEHVEDVTLIELWPTVKQKEKCVNAETTAEFIDLLRFYYNNIWMPWDDQDDRILLPKTVEERMKLWCDLHNGTIMKHIARQITLLRMSAIDAHEKLKELDSTLYEGNIADDDGDDDDDSLLSANYISLCAEMTARLDCIMAKWTLYENPLIREHYINKETNKWLKNKKGNTVVALWKGGSVLELDEICKFLKGQDTDEKEVKVMTNAEEAFALEPKQVVICSQEFEIPEIPLANTSICSFIGGGIKASSTRSWLLCVSEHCALRGLQLQCASVVNTLVVARAGELRLSRCSLTDDSSTDQSDFTQGIVAMPGAKVILEDCTLNNFYSGIVIHRGAQVDIRGCVISKCGVGIQLYGGAHVKLDNTTVTGCTENSIRCEMDNTHFDNDRVQELQIMPNCKVDSGYMNKKVLVVHQEATLL